MDQLGLTIEIEQVKEHEKELEVYPCSGGGAETNGTVWVCFSEQMILGNI